MTSSVEALRIGLRDLGYVEGRNIVIEFRWAEGKYDRLPDLVAELIRLNVDVIVTHGTPGMRAAKKATSTISVVMAIRGDAIATGLVASLARPEANVAGLYSTTQCKAAHAGWLGIGPFLHSQQGRARNLLLLLPARA